VTRAEALAIATDRLTRANDGGDPQVIEAHASIARTACMVYDRLPAEPEPAPPSGYLHPTPG
jgi:hypothetical protein